MLGSRGTETGTQLWEKIKGVASDNSLIMTDYWKAYGELLPQERHVKSKKETFAVEGYNSLLRHFLARLRRKTTCYSKSKEMLFYSLMLLMEKQNNGLSILN